MDAKNGQNPPLGEVLGFDNRLGTGKKPGLLWREFPGVEQYRPSRAAALQVESRIAGSIWKGKGNLLIFLYLIPVATITICLLLARLE